MRTYALTLAQLLRFGLDTTGEAKGVEMAATETVECSACDAEIDATQADMNRGLCDDCAAAAPEPGAEPEETPEAEDGEGPIEQKEGGGLFDEQLANVIDCQVMAGTKCWHELYEWIVSDIALVQARLEGEEKTATIHKLQGRIAAMRGVLEQGYRPVAVFTTEHQDMPIFKLPQPLTARVDAEGFVLVTHHDPPDEAEEPQDADDDAPEEPTDETEE